MKAGWSAQLELGFERQAGRTVLSRRKRQGPLSVQRAFYPEGEVCHLYLLHPPGGVVGSDELHITAQLEKESHALITTPGAGKFYRSTGATATMEQYFSLAEGARLEWLPQENIFFPGAQVQMKTRFDLASDVWFAFWETHCLGRPAIQKEFDTGKLDSRLEIWRDGIPLLLERLRVDAETRQQLALLRGMPVVATLVMSPAEKAHLETARQVIEHANDRHYDCAATLLEELLVVRFLGDSTERVQKLFVAIWSALRPAILGKPAIVPRIWNT